MREGLIAFTLGELGILTAFILIFSLAAESGPPHLTEAQADSLRSELEDQKEVITALRDTLSKLRSPQRPACQETEIIDGYLLNAEVIGRNQFLIQEDTLTLADIRNRFAANLESAEQVDCVHQAVVQAGDGITAETFVAGFNLLSQLFYVRASGRP